MNPKVVPYRIVSSIFLLSMGLSPVLSQAQPGFSIKNTAVHGAFITDYLQNHNTDDDFGHYATNSGSNVVSNAKESRFSITGSLSDMGGIKTTFKTGFDFMGNKGFEIVSAWIRLEKGRYYFIAGKTENLVATGETTLNYDGFYSSGGIQTGAKANQNQIQWGFQLTGHLKLAVSLTDEPAQNGSTDKETFSTDRPDFEAAIFFHFNWGNGKIAGHSGDMRLHSGTHFHPGIIMTEWNFPVTETLSWLISGFRARAGSQFFTTDLLFDCARLPDGRIHEFTSTGGLSQLIFASGNLESWMGAGIFSLSGYSELHLREDHPHDAITHNHRLSIGLRYHFPHKIHVGLELSRYKSIHLMESDISTFYGKSVHLQISITF
ncbi:MAG: hypothetical protein GXO69_11355 [Acidobacteria bacterium]|nr:hypothetical protein [Acidobacteriota bacterium]